MVQVIEIRRHIGERHTYFYNKYHIMAADVLAT